jgi:hypothetical protein
MISKVKLVKGLCVSVAMLLIAGNAVGAAAQDPRALQRNAMSALQPVSNEIHYALGEHPGDQHLLLVQSAFQAVSADNHGQPLSAGRASQNRDIALLSASIYSMCMAIHRGVGDRSNPMEDMEIKLNQLLANRAQ